LIVAVVRKAKRFAINLVAIDRLKKDGMKDHRYSKLKSFVAQCTTLQREILGATACFVSGMTMRLGLFPTGQKHTTIKSSKLFIISEHKSENAKADILTKDSDSAKRFE
tara:strand:+ start:4227 stop:4553 length:327 start_codon:yes stop_codon:yes gene_type:complete